MRFLPRSPVEPLPGCWAGHHRSRPGRAFAPGPGSRRAALAFRPPQPRPWLLLAALAALAASTQPSAARAEASLAQCQRWLRSSGLERITLGNALGSAAYLTKLQRLAESDPEHPRLLYSEADLQRTCDAWR